VVKRNAPLWDGEEQYFICIGRIKYVGDLKKYDFYGIILLCCSIGCGFDLYTISQDGEVERYLSA